MKRIGKKKAARNEPPLASGCKATLEVETQLRSQSSWRYIMRSAERRQEIVERVPVRQVDDSQLRAPFVFVAVKQIVVAK